MKDKTKNLTASYDPDADVLSLSVSPDEPIDHAREIGNLVVHFNEQGEPVFIEILEASRILRRELPPLSQMAAKFV